MATTDWTAEWEDLKCRISGDASLSDVDYVELLETISCDAESMADAKTSELEADDDDSEDA